MGYISPCHLGGLQHLQPGRNLHLPTVIILPLLLQPRIEGFRSPQQAEIGAITSFQEPNLNTSAKLDTLLGSKFPPSFQGRPRSEKSLQSGTKRP